MFSTWRSSAISSSGRRSSTGLKVRVIDQDRCPSSQCLIKHPPEEDLVCYLAKNAQPRCVRILLEVWDGPPDHLRVRPVKLVYQKILTLCAAHLSPSRSETRLSSERDWSRAAVRLSETMKRELSLPALRTLTNFLRASRKSSGPVVEKRIKVFFGGENKNHLHRGK